MAFLFVVSLPLDLFTCLLYTSCAPLALLHFVLFPFALASLLRLFVVSADTAVPLSLRLFGVLLSGYSFNAVSLQTILCRSHVWLAWPLRISRANIFSWIHKLYANSLARISQELAWSRCLARDCTTFVLARSHSLTHSLTHSRSVQRWPRSFYTLLAWQPNSIRNLRLFTDVSEWLWPFERHLGTVSTNLQCVASGWNAVCSTSGCKHVRVAFNPLFFFAGKYFENSQAFIVLVVVASTSIYFHICSQFMLYCVWFFARSMPPKPVPWVIQQLFMSLISIIAGDLFHSTSYIRSALISFGFSIFSSLFSAVAFSWIFVDAISMRYHCCLHIIVIDARVLLVSSAELVNFCAVQSLILFVRRRRSLFLPLLRFWLLLLLPKVFFVAVIVVAMLFRFCYYFSWRHECGTYYLLMLFLHLLTATIDDLSCHRYCTITQIDFNLWLLIGWLLNGLLR